MADTGKQDPLGVNVLGSILNDQGLTINPIVTNYVGTSTNNYTYSPGKIITDTALNFLVYAINDAYIRSNIDNNTFSTVNAATYGNLISIGLLPTETIPALGLAKSPGYIIEDPSGVWTTQAVAAATDAGMYNPQPGPATSGFPVDSQAYQGQYATWVPYNLTNVNKSITQWGFLHCFSLQAFNEFYYNNPATYNNITLSNVVITGTRGQFSCNPSKAPLVVGQTLTISGTKGGGGTLTGYVNPTTYFIVATNGSTTFQLGNLNTAAGTPTGLTYTVNTSDYNSYGNISTSLNYTDFLGSFQNADGFINSTNKSINSVNNAKDFLEGTFSNMNDLITGDVTGVSLATQAFGSDLINLGNVINLSKLDTFGLPSVLLQTLYQNNAVTEDLNLALLANGLQFSDILGITNETLQPTVQQETKIYSSFLLIQGENLKQVLIPLNCKTENLETLADLLNVQKMFPNSYTSLTVPVYNTAPGPTNSKTYYPIYGTGSLNPALTNPNITEKVGAQIIPGSPAPNTDNQPSITTVATTLTTVPTAPAVPIITTNNNVLQTFIDELDNIRRIDERGTF